jgi:hypothetical protein
MTPNGRLGWNTSPRIQNIQSNLTEHSSDVLETDQAIQNSIKKKQTKQKNNIIVPELSGWGSKHKIKPNLVYFFKEGA